MGLVIRKIKTKSYDTKTYQEWLYDIVRRGNAADYDVKESYVGSIVWVETKIFGKWRKYEITEKELANKLINTNPVDFRIMPINIEKQLIRDYKTSYLCSRFRLITWIFFITRQVPIIKLTKQRAYSASIVILSLVMIILMIITIMVTIT